MTISPLDTDLFSRGNDFLADAATTSQCLKDMTYTNNHTNVHHNTISTDAQHDLELNFLSEFLLHEDFATDATLHSHTGTSTPSQTYPPSFDLKLDTTGNESASSTYQHAHRPAQHTYSPHSSASSADASEVNELPLDRKAKRRQQVAISARRHRSRKKHELLDLRKEVSYMTSQLEFLRSKHKMMRPNGAVAEWEEKAVAQRLKRRQAEGQNEELRRAIFLQSQFLNNLKSVFNNSPLFTADINLRQLLHTYTRLGCNPRSRQRDYAAICTDSKLHMAMDILKRQTESITFSRPFIQTQFLETQDMFGSTIVSVYAFDTLDVQRVFQASCSAIAKSSVTWPQFTSRGGKRQILDGNPKSNIVYGKQTIQYRVPSENTIMDATPTPSTEEIVVDSRVLSFWKLTETEGMLVWDFVDQDDLHPLSTQADVRRDMIGAALVRRELCEDGRERVVCRSICSKLHSRPNGGPWSRSDAKKALLARFAAAPATDVDHTCGQVVHDLIEQGTTTPRPPTIASS